MNECSSLQLPNNTFGLVVGLIFTHKISDVLRLSVQMQDID